MAVCHGRGELRTGSSIDITRPSVRGVTCLGTHLHHDWSGAGSFCLVCLCFLFIFFFYILDWALAGR